MDEHIYKQIEAEAIATGGDMLQHMNPQKYTMIEPFIGRINKPNPSEIMKILGLSNNIPVITFDIDKPIYIKDIQDDNRLDDNIKEICYKIRRNDMRESAVYWNRSNMTNIGLNKSTLRKYCKTRMVLGEDTADKEGNTIKGFGFDKTLLNQKNRDFQCVQILDASEIESVQILDAPETEYLHGMDASIVQRKCAIGEYDKYIYIEPSDSLTQRKMDAVYLRTDEVMDILMEHGSLPICKYVCKLYDALLSYSDYICLSMKQIAYAISSEQRQCKLTKLLEKQDKTIEKIDSNHREIMGRLTRKHDRVITNDKDPRVIAIYRHNTWPKDHIKVFGGLKTDRRYKDIIKDDSYTIVKETQNVNNTAKIKKDITQVYKLQKHTLIDDKKRRCNTLKMPESILQKFIGDLQNIDIDYLNTMADSSDSTESLINIKWLVISRDKRKVDGQYGLYMALSDTKYINEDDDCLYVQKQVYNDYIIGDIRNDLSLKGDYLIDDDDGLKWFHSTIKSKKEFTRLNVLGTRI